MSATPAFADNGPHVASKSDMTVDRCAGCHRAHTAQDSYLLKTAQTSLCETCHDGTGATTDVIKGVSTGTGGGALRAGGFEFALIDSKSGVTKASVGTLADATVSASTSAHTVGQAGTAWGGGPSGKDGTTITLECGSCHDPHGNGNYRILRPVPADAAGLTLAPAVAITSIKPTGYWIAAGRNTYTYEVTTTAAHQFKPTDNITIMNTGSVYDGTVLAVVGPPASPAGILAGSVSQYTSDVNNARVAATTDATHFTFTSSTNYAVTTGAVGSVSYANAQGIAKVLGAGGVATYTTWNLHGLYTGQTVTIAGVVPTAYNTTGVVTVVDKLTFTMVNASTAAYTSGGAITGIPDAKTKVYTTTNYWKQDDHNYTPTAQTGFLSASAPAESGGPTAFISNVSAWCAQCHNRLFAGSGAWDYKNTGDTKYTYMHRSQNGKENSPNCITCHVAHGSNASMAGNDKLGNPYSPNANEKYSNLVGTEFTGMSAGDSFLLRVDNRGTCNMCHNL
jgi:predicted CXXCH cytochrome family protein